MSVFEGTWQEYKTDATDIEERLSESVAQLYPHHQPPKDDLFALNGLGQEPRTPNIRGDR
jgi:hypothetical protein